jgi:primosomal protein N' (replication factor Y) (superfamily II helicase)
MFAEVVFPIPLDRSFSYSVSPPLRARTAVGMRAIVPFGARLETGYIVGVHDTCTRDGVKPLEDLPDEAPVFQPSMLALCRWMADYYCCSFGEALQCAVPSGIHVRSKRKYTLLTQQLGTGRFTDRQRKVIAELYRRGPLTEGQLAKAVGRGALSPTLQSLTGRGIVLAEPVTVEAGVKMHTEGYAVLVEEAIPPHEVLAKLQRNAPKQASVYLDLLNGEPVRRAAELYARHQADSGVLRTLESKGLIRREERELLRAPAFHADAASAEKWPLNAEQASSHEAIVSAIAQERFQTFLLEGITGSGKTEVYLQAIEFALAHERDAILLVPEISLTPQTVGRLLGRFKTAIAVLHSGLGRGERYDEWRRAHRGDVRIVVGARSAVFAPLGRLGLVVVDEEHDSSYKQSETPRYHARDVAIMRAKLAGAACVLGSATPSIESYYNTTIGKSERLVLSRRATNALLPEVKLVDMRHEARETGGHAILSRSLEEAVTSCVSRGDQAILLLNRRGHSPFVLCPKCGWVGMCDDCHVSLTYHASGGRMKCHYCSAEQEVPAACRTCGFKPLIFLGTGTQKVEDLLLRTFASCRIERMDADTTAGKGGHAKILGRFAAGEIDILIGTQMIAKGHDYPGVTLVGVVNADTCLSMPDFRAAEQTYQLLTQVAGRAGRGARPGTVMIQTFRPGHYAIQAACRHAYTPFFTQEIEERKAAGYPPFRRMANFGIECEDPEGAARAVGRLHRMLRGEIERLGFSGVEILGPAPALVRRVKKKYRWNLGMLSRSASRLNRLARATREAFEHEHKGGAVQLKVDLDPYGIF